MSSPILSKHITTIVSLVSLVISGVVLADDYLFTSNKDGNGAEGVRLTVSTKYINATYPTVPCVSSANLVDWSPNGASWGIARDHDMPGNGYLWASISSTTSSDCGASSNECVGAAYYDISAGTVSQSFDPNWNSSNATVVDISANYPDIIALEKRASGTVVQWDDSTSTYAHTTGYAHLSQIDWIDLDYFASTVAGTTSTTCNDSSIGDLVVGEVGNSSEISSTAVALPSGAGGTDSTKPEGVSVANIRQGYSASCSAGTTDVIYVVDWCQSQLIVYSIDVTDATPTPVEEDRIDLDGTSSLYDEEDEECHPSSVTWHTGNNKVYVLCQNRDSIIRIDTSPDQCDLAWDDEALLTYYNSGGNPTCTNTPTMQNCSNCQPHDIAYDSFVSPGWLFVALDPYPSGSKGQILTIDKDTLSDQFLVYRDASGTYAPLELDILPGSPP